MPAFVFEAMDSQGKEVRNEVEATSSDAAAAKIREMGLFPTKVTPKDGGGPAPAGLVPGVAVGKGKKSLFTIGGVGNKQLTMFTRQWSTLMDAGLPIVRSLDILANQMKPGLLKNATLQARDDVAAGSSLSEALAQHPRAFDKLYIAMVKAGEAGGVLDTMLSRLADFREKSQKLRTQVIGALIYPIAVISIATVILAVIMVYIIPQFEKMFEDMDIKGGMPAVTRLLMAIANTMRTYWYLLPGVPFVLIVLNKLISMNPTGRYVIDTIKLNVPVFGMIVSKGSISRFCRTLGTLIQSGVPILEALNIIKNATGNAVIAKAITDVHNSIREGDTIAEPLRHQPVFDDIVVNMIDVGEETGDLDSMLIKIADNYDSEVDALVGGMMSLLEPFLIVGMGLTVGFIVIALFLPLNKLIEGIS